MPIPPEKEGARDSHPSEDLRHEVAAGLRHMHTRASSNIGKLLEVASFAQAAIELLAEQGLLDIAEFDRRKAVLAERLVKKFTEEGMGAAYQNPEFDKYAFDKTVDIDCESRLEVCKAACCRLRFALSRQDVKEAIVQWEFSHPYFIAHSTDCYCRHLDQKGQRCTIHDNRPVPCRGYDCRNYQRIWSDFDKPRPVVILQDDSFEGTDSIIMCAFTTDAPLFRLAVEPNGPNGLRAHCRLMVDKVTTVQRSKLGARIGRLDDEDILRLNQALLVFLGLAVSPRANRGG